MALRAFVVGHRPEDRYLAGRTLRSLTTAGLDAHFASASDRQVFFPTGSTSSPTLIVRAGAWLGDATPIQFPERNATGRPTCAFGRLLGPPGDELNQWKAALSRSGGDFNRPPANDSAWPSPVSLYLDAAATTALSATNAPTPLSFAELAALGFRVVHFPRLDVHLTSSLRVMQVITALHRGGAERLTLDLVDFLSKLGVQTRLATLGRPFRSTFPSPAGTLERLNPSQLHAFAIAAGFDLFHAHLVNLDIVKTLSANRFPLLVTLHNARMAWPTGMDKIALPDASLLAACSRAVESEAAAAGINIPIRTVWNGIRLKASEPTRAIQLRGRHLRNSWGFGDDDIVLLALANPRPQKRLHLLPAILEALSKPSNGWARAVAPSFSAPTVPPRPSTAPGSERLVLSPDRRQFRLVLAGEATSSPSDRTKDHPDSLEADFQQRGIMQHVRMLGFVEDTAALISACDALVSTSAFEGLSLAQLECLAQDRPVIATAVGGAPEVAEIHPALRLVPVDATPAAFAQAIIAAVATRTRDADEATCSFVTNDRQEDHPPNQSPSSHCLAPFSTESMAARYLWLYRRAIAMNQPPEVLHANPPSIPWSSAESCAPSALPLNPGIPSNEPSALRPKLWLITNNFSTGGAQSSARRLLRELHSRVIDVRAAVVQEEPEHPTPGRQALLDSGIPVVAVPPPDRCSPEAAVEALLHHLDAAPASAVFFWNLIPVYKILLVDALLTTPVYDISPGEMLFDSLDRYFASPLPHLPYRCPRDYASRLAGVVVKYSREHSRAESTFRIPVHLIPNGINSADFPQKQSLTTTDPESLQAPLVFGTSARLHPHKRVEDLIDALKEAHSHLPPWRLCIAGGVENGCESYAESLREQGRGLPIEWLGDVPDIRPFLASLDLFLMISEPAGCPNAILEAMASGLPLIATDVGGAQDLIEHQTSGWLVSPRDPRAFADALMELARDRDLRHKLGLAARQRVEEHFTVPQMADRYLALISPPPVHGTGPM